MLEWIEEIEEKNRKKVKAKYTKATDFESKIKVLHDWHPKGYLNIEPIRHLDDYLKCIRVISNSSTWYRGESREHEQLIPKLYRNIKASEINQALIKEKKYFYEFKRRAQSIVDNIAINDFWSWYFLIQHYGGPTRLLDWTSNAAVALFMALDTSREKKDNPIVYLLQPTTLTDYAFDDIGIDSDVHDSGIVLYPGDAQTDKWILNLSSSNFDLPDSPISLLPAYSDPRIISQKSCFTLFGKRLNGFIKDDKQIVCKCCGRKILNKIIIDGESKNLLRDELDKIGISSDTVYPGLEGLSKKIYQEIF